MQFFSCEALFVFKLQGCKKNIFQGLRGEGSIDLISVKIEWIQLMITYLFKKSQKTLGFKDFAVESWCSKKRMEGGGGTTIGEFLRSNVPKRMERFDWWNWDVVVDGWLTCPFLMKSFKYIYLYIYSIFEVTTGKIRWENYEYSNYRLHRLIICNSMNYYCTLSTVCVWDLFIFSILMVREICVFFNEFYGCNIKLEKTLVVLCHFLRDGEKVSISLTHHACVISSNASFGWKIWNPLLLCLLSGFLSKISCEHQLTLIIWCKKKGMKKKLPSF